MIRLVLLCILVGRCVSSSLVPGIPIEEGDEFLGRVIIGNSMSDRSVRVYNGHEWTVYTQEIIPNSDATACLCGLNHLHTSGVCRQIAYSQRDSEAWVRGVETCTVHPSCPGAIHAGNSHYRTCSPVERSSISMYRRTSVEVPMIETELGLYYRFVLPITWFRLGGGYTEPGYDEFNIGIQYSEAGALPFPLIEKVSGRIHRTVGGAMQDNTPAESLEFSEDILDTGDVGQEQWFYTVWVKVVSGASHDSYMLVKLGINFYDSDNLDFIKYTDTSYMDPVRMIDTGASLLVRLRGSASTSQQDSLVREHILATYKTPEELVGERVKFDSLVLSHGGGSMVGDSGFNLMSVGYVDIAVSEEAEVEGEEKYAVFMYPDTSSSFDDPVRRGLLRAETEGEPFVDVERLRCPTWGTYGVRMSDPQEENGAPVASAFRRYFLASKTTNSDFSARQSWTSFRGANCSDSLVGICSSMLASCSLFRDLSESLRAKGHEGPYVPDCPPMTQPHRRKTRFHIARFLFHVMEEKLVQHRKDCSALIIGSLDPSVKIVSKLFSINVGVIAKTNRFGSERTIFTEQVHRMRLFATLDPGPNVDYSMYTVQVTRDDQSVSPALFFSNSPLESTPDDSWRLFRVETPFVNVQRFAWGANISAALLPDPANVVVTPISNCQLNPVFASLAPSLRAVWEFSHSMASFRRFDGACNESRFLELLNREDLWAVRLCRSAGLPEDSGCKLYNPSYTPLVAHRTCTSCSFSHPDVDLKSSTGVDHFSRALDSTKFEYRPNAVLSGIVFYSGVAAGGVDTTLRFRVQQDFRVPEAVDCVVGPFVKQTDCSKSCGSGFETWSRSVTTSPQDGGKPCPPLEEQRSCNTHPCPVNCAVSSWGPFGDCNATCAGGYQSRTRDVITEPRHNGTACPHLVEQRQCNTHPCPIDCEVSQWGEWGVCSTTCGGGLETRTRDIETHPEHGGEECPPLTEQRPCNTHPCPIDCEVSNWGEWSVCSATCGGGSESRTRDITTHPEHGGEGCPPLAEQRQCNTHPCPIHCVQSDWEDWTTCSKPCRDENGPGTQTGYRRTLVAPLHGGDACGPGSMERDCNTQHCPVDCELHPWSAWSECSVTCGGGTRTRTRGVKVEAQYGGTACDPLVFQSQDCNTHECAVIPDPVDCVVSDWGDWTVCTQSCGGTGTQTRFRSVDIPAEHGGDPCPDDLQETRQCNTHPCPVNCVVSQWGPPGDCNTTCGGGFRLETRTIITIPAHGGSPCPALVNYVPCNTQPCPVDCKVSAWGEWSPCSATCGGGLESRTRNVTTQPKHGGESCPSVLFEERDCNTHYCPVDCVVEGSWGEWSPCNATCGGGYKERNRSVLIAPEHNGSPCSATYEILPCATQECETVCVFGEWSGWSQCSSPCGPGFRNRTRVVLPESQGDVEVVCTGVFQTEECNLGPCASGSGDTDKKDNTVIAVASVGVGVVIVGCIVAGYLFARSHQGSPGFRTMGIESSSNSESGNRNRPSVNANNPPPNVMRYLAV